MNDPEHTPALTPERNNDTPAPALGIPLPDSIVIPDHVPEARALPLWPANTYLMASGTGAEKLRSSAVAPLVAAARGYETVLPSGTQCRDAALRLGLGTLNKRTGILLRTAVGTGDCLVMPWFSAPDVTTAAIKNEFADPAVHQLRPARAVVTKSGNKPAKYLFATDTGLVIDVHPSTPLSFMASAPTTLITEGCLKGDAALTAMLRAAGISDIELANASEGAQQRLRALLESIPESQRALVVSLGGVGTWHKNAVEWNVLPIRQKSAVWVAFDGDVKTNRNVYRQAEKLWELCETMHAIPLMVDLEVPSAIGVTVKVGIDDFLAAHGRWSDLFGRLRPELPATEFPEIIRDASKGDIRMNQTTLVSEEFVVTDPDAGGQWKPGKVAMIGRIAGYDIRRSVTVEEELTGKYDFEVGKDAMATVQIECQWIDKEGEHHSSMVVGPSDLQGQSPKDWPQRGARIPRRVSGHRHWPPSMEWLGGVKATREEEIEDRTSWGHMGWVPSPDGDPVFVVGKQVIGVDGFTPDAATPGVTNDLLARAESFGVGLARDDDQARADLLALVDMFYLSGVWQDHRIGALVIAAMLRPAVPTRTSVSILFAGPPRKGKSFTASAIMSGWSATLGCWAKQLPGSAKDTSASIENAISRTPIWVVDDLAPSQDARTAAQEQAKFEDMFRSNFNGSGKRRMTVEMGAREVLSPKALLIGTAENIPSGASAMDRTICVNIPAHSLAEDRSITERLVQMTTKTGEPRRVVGEVIRSIALTTQNGSWEKTLTSVADFSEMYKEHAAFKMGDGPDTARHAGIAADICLGLMGGSEHAVRLGLDIEPWTQMLEGVISLISDHYVHQSTVSPGRSVLDALQQLLASGKAHIISSGVGGPPATGENDTRINQALGWAMNGDGTSHGRGPSIGQLLHTKAGVKHIVFYPVAAFNAARASFPDQLQAGSSSATAWGSAWDEGLASGWARGKNSAGAYQVYAKVGPRSDQWNGVPFPLSTLLTGSSADTDTSDANADPAVQA